MTRVRDTPEEAEGPASAPLPPSSASAPLPSPTVSLGDLSPLIEDLSDSQITSFFKLLPPGPEGRRSH